MWFLSSRPAKLCFQNQHSRLWKRIYLLFSHTKLTSTWLPQVSPASQTLLGSYRNKLITHLGSKDSKEISDLLQSYRNALVKSSPKDVIKLYTSDALLMAQGFPIVSSKDSILTWYENCFELITLDVEFDIKEVVVTSGEYAFATTTSAGTQKDNASGKVTHEGNHELFIIQKVDGAWKIARYCFSTTKG